MVRIAILVLAWSFAAQAAEPGFDPEAARLQAAEAAVRAGASTPRAVVRSAPPARSTTAEADGRFLPLGRNAAPREFPLPPRNDAAPSANGLRALVAAAASAPPRPSTEDNADARATAAGLEALQGFRRSHGLH
jgi:hypothetical protein